MMHEPKGIYDLSFTELSTMLNSWGEPDYRATQIWEGLYRQFWSSADEFSNLPKDLRYKLVENFRIDRSKFLDQLIFSSLRLLNKIKSSDGRTEKALFSIHDGFAVEAVIMKYAKRRTLCISTQAGCAMGCVFCATGQIGFHSQLSSGEIIQQVMFYARELSVKNERVTNIVMMGMGEPFHNYDAVMEAIDRLNDPRGFNLGARHFTISTVGFVPGIRRFTREKRQVNLAISLHAADDDLRSQLLPINKKYSLDEVFSAALEYVQLTHRRISFEWALIDGVNDTQEQANLLAQKIKPFHINNSSLCHVNIILLNPTQQYEGQASTHLKALNFQKVLNKSGFSCTIRLRRGIDIQAGCGQLAGRNNKNTRITF